MFYSINALSPICILLLLSSIVPQAIADEVEHSKPDEPTVVFVGVTKAELHSGPSKEYYPTAMLDRGTMLEVYRKTADGWLGVRPPQGSFSWVQAKDAYLLPGGRVIEITEDDAVSWIGTELGTAKQYRWQVDLKPGEQLVVLSEASMEDSEGNASLWYKIAPPSGEFRWIQEAAVTTKAPKLEPKPKAAPTQSGDLETKSILESENSVDATESSPAAGSVTTASSMNSQSEAVKTAQYTEDVFSEGQIVHEGTMIGEGEIVYEGQAMHNGRVVHDGDVIYEGEYFEGQAPAELGPVYNHAHATTPNAAPNDFGGYHAFQLGDDGLRFLLAERYLKKRGPMIDPLEYDPFSLAMPVRNDLSPNTRVPPGVIPRRTDTSGSRSGPVITSSGYEPPQGIRRDRPWRDPRSLRQNRLSGYTASPTDRTPRELVNDIRDQVNRLGDTVRGMASKGTDNFNALADGDRSFGISTENDQAERFADRTSSTAGDSLNFYSPPVIDADTQSLSSNGGVDSGGSGGSSAAKDVDWYGVNRGGENTAVNGFNSNTNATYSTAATPSIRGELEQLEVRLTDMVAKPPSLWNLDPIMARTRELIDRGANPVERGQARLLLERAEKFQEHARRSAFVPGANFQAGYQQSPSTSPSPFQMASNRGVSPITTAGYQQPNRPVSNAATSATLQYDATGWLVPVHGSAPGQPTHALTNSSGAVIAYVTGLPGMNLNLYVNQPVGVIGLRGYLPQLQAGHIQAEKILPLR